MKQKIQGWVIALVAVACFTQQDLWDAECAVGCRREGYTSGQFDGKAGCFCADHYNFQSITGKRLTLPGKASKKESTSYAPSVRRYPNATWMDE
jgi:hypothetical protein